LPFAKDGINKQIELAILRADKMGVKVLSLAALNKVCFFFSAIFFLDLLVSKLVKKLGQIKRFL
jgi:hypothetical protein